MKIELKFENWIENFCIEHLLFDLIGCKLN